MFYPHIVLLIALLIVINMMSTKGTTANKDLKINSFKIEVLYEKENTLAKAIDRYILENNKKTINGFVEGLGETTFVNDLKLANQLSNSFLNNNGLDKSYEKEYENFVILNNRTADEFNGIFAYEIINNSYVRIKHFISYTLYVLNKDRDELQQIIDDNSGAIEGTPEYNLLMTAIKEQTLINQYIEQEKFRIKNIKRTYLNHYKRESEGIASCYYSDNTPAINCRGLSPEITDSNILMFHDFQLSNNARSVLISSNPELPNYLPRGEGYLPVGSIQAFLDYNTDSKCPVGWLPANGDTVNSTTYPILAEIMTTLPDLRGEFLRGVDDNRGIDIGRIINSFQNQSQNDLVTNTTINETSFPTGETTINSNYQLVYTGLSRVQTGLEMKWNTLENRPRNVSVRYCIKHDYK